MSFSNFLDVPSQMPKPCLKEGECCKIGSDPSAVHLKQQMFLKKPLTTNLARGVGHDVAWHHRSDCSITNHIQPPSRKGNVFLVASLAKQILTSIIRIRRVL